MLYITSYAVEKYFVFRIYRDNLSLDDSIGITEISYRSMSSPGNASKYCTTLLHSWCMALLAETDF